VTVEYADDKPARITAVVLSTQHAPDVSYDKLRQDVIEQLIRPALPANLIDDKTVLHVNPTGRFVVGGPMGDAGLTGRKIIVGHLRRHGPARRRRVLGQGPVEGRPQRRLRGALGGEEPREAGIARRAEVQLAYAIGVAQPVSIRVDTFGTSKLDFDQLERLVRDHFDLTPRGIIEALDLRRPIYRADGLSRTLRARRPGLPLGGDVARRGAAPRGGALSACCAR
jgi:S-adenosylmethionine synthetase